MVTIKNIIRITTLVLAFSMLAALTGCGGGSDVSERFEQIDESADQSEETEEGTVDETDADGNMDLTTEEYLSPYVKFYELYYVIQEDDSSSNIGLYLEGMDVCSDSVLIDTAVDDSDVDVTKVGTYTITYKLHLYLDDEYRDEIVTKSFHVVSAGTFRDMVEAWEIRKLSNDVAISLTPRTEEAGEPGGSGEMEDAAVLPGGEMDDPIGDAGPADPDALDPSDTYDAPQATASLSGIDEMPDSVPGGEVQEPEATAFHVHSYVSATIEEATCTTPGVILYTCVCGDYFEEEIRPTGHNWGDRDRGERILQYRNGD